MSLLFIASFLSDILVAKCFHCPDFKSWELRDSENYFSGLLGQNGVLRDEHIVFLGDSIMRYQYLALVYSIKFGHLLNETHNPNLVEEKQWPSWVAFYHGTSALLSPNEFCDCYRPPQNATGKLKWGAQLENRYFYSLEHRTNITYFQWAGYPVRGHWMDHGDSDAFRLPRGHELPPFWEKNDIVDFIKGNLPLLKPRPTVLVINIGIHIRYMNNHHRYNDFSYMRSIIDAAKGVVKRIIWRTTTFPRQEKSHNDRFSSDALDDSRDKFMCSLSDIICLNTSWTRCLDSASYWDHFHVKANSYNKLNHQLIEILAINEKN